MQYLHPSECESMVCCLVCSRLMSSLLLLEYLGRMEGSRETCCMLVLPYACILQY